MYYKDFEHIKPNCPKNQLNFEDVLPGVGVSKCKKVKIYDYLGKVNTFPEVRCYLVSVLGKHPKIRGANIPCEVEGQISFFRLS